VEEVHDGEVEVEEVVLAEVEVAVIIQVRVIPLFSRGRAKEGEAWI
jgi:hypothetical protein